MPLAETIIGTTLIVLLVAGSYRAVKCDGGKLFEWETWERVNRGPWWLKTVGQLRIGDREQWENPGLAGGQAVQTDEPLPPGPPA